MIRGTYFSELIESSVNLSEEYENYRMPRQLFTKGNKAAMWLLKQAFNLNTKALNGTSSIGGFAVYSPYSTFSNIDRYITIDSLYSVVKFRARTAGLIPFRVYKIKNQQKLKEYQYKTQMKDFTTQGMVRKLLLKFQAMEEVDEVIKKGYGVIEKSIR